MGKTIIIGAGGQIGTELTLALRNQYATDQIIAADIKEVAPTLIQDGPYVQMDILNRDAVRSYIIDNQSIKVIDSGGVADILEVQWPGKRRMQTSEFLRGSLLRGSFALNGQKFE